MRDISEQFVARFVLGSMLLFSFAGFTLIGCSIGEEPPTASALLDQPTPGSAPEIGPWVTPDETLLLFSSNREGGEGYMDFYACDGDGTLYWVSSDILDK